MTPSQLPERLAELERQGLYRQRRIVSRVGDVEVEVDGQLVVNFCSNDYLGLANHPAVLEAFRRGAERYGVGSGASHLVCGHGPAHHALEEELADFVGRPRALLFSTGYMANLGVISSLVSRGGQVFEDRLNHASLLDGALLSGARLRRFAHGDYQSWCGEIGEGDLVVTDGVFSMDGDLASLPEVAEIAGRSGAWLMLDDAHGLGVLGVSGRGVLEHFSLGTEDAPVLVGTLGKAFGTFGAFVAGSHDLIEFLIQRARTYIYTTALPPAVAEATRASLKLIGEEAWRREKLQGLVGYFRKEAATLGLQLMDSQTPIQPILVGDNQAAVQASRQLLKAGFLVTAIRPPTVPAGSARLRVTFSAAHETSHVDALLAALVRLDLSVA